MAAIKRKGAVGIIGLGIMGGSFARNLAAAGWRVIGVDPNPARRKEAKKAGVEIMDNARALAAEVQTIITSLPHSDALETTVRSIIAAREPHRVVIEASTFTIEDKERAEKALRKAGHIMLDCPVSGTGAQARVKDLVFYASGDSASIAKLHPMFGDFSRRVYDLGAFGNGSRMKYVANLLVAIHNVATAEAMVLGMKAGLDPKTIYDLVAAGAGNSRVFQLRAPMMVKNNYDDATMKISIWQKDMKIIGEFAKKIKSPTPLLNATLPVYAAAMKTGHANHDTAAVCVVLESQARLQRKSKRKSARPAR